MSQKQVAKIAHLSDSYIAWLEMGKRNPSHSVCISLARTLGLSVDEVLRAAGYRAPDEPVYLEPQERQWLDMLRETRPDLRRVVIAGLKDAWEQTQASEDL